MDKSQAGRLGGKAKVPKGFAKRKDLAKKWGAINGKKNAKT